jgi:hypothetical protein
VLTIKLFAEISPYSFENENIWPRIQHSAVCANKIVLLLDIVSPPH